MSTTGPNKELISKIATLTSDCTQQEAQSALLPSLEACLDASSKSGSSDGVTPLMVVCDRGQAETFRFLLGCAERDERYWQVIGSVHEKAPGSGNTAIHHAAMSGRWEIMQQLLELRAPNEPMESLLNNHGDTPIMMAVVQGCVDLLGLWLPKIQSPLTLRIRNSSGDSAISLACGYGHGEILQLFLNDLAILHDEDLKKAEAALAKMNALAKHKQGLEVTTVREIEAKRDDIQDCVAVLRKAFNRRADEMAKSFLRDEETMEASKKTTLRNPKKLPKKKEKNLRTRRRSEPSDDNQQASSTSKNKKEKEPKVDAADPVRLVQLPDGTQAVCVKGRLFGMEQSTNSSSPCLIPTTLAQKTADELFRDQFGGSEIKDIMDALCLNVSQLLLSPHSMALNLSPSQLDAVDDILKRQLAAVVQARNIQERLHETAKEGPA